MEGKGSFQNSTPLKEFAKEMIARGYKDFVVDLKGCPVMDSTFMGTLASIALKTRSGDSGGLQVINLNERTQDLLRNLGLDQLMKLGAVLAEGAAPETNTLDAARADKATEARTMLEAHEAVVEANPENEAKFKDVLDFLRQDVQAKR